MTNDKREALMDVPQMIARAQYWHGWCIDHEIENRELERLRWLLNSVIGHLQDERDAVFEQAHTPTSDEREALAGVIRDADMALPPGALTLAKWSRHLAGSILAAGFRRTVQGEPTDAQVEAGCVAFYEHASGLTSWSRLVEYDTVLADRYREGIRRSLRAAAAVQEGKSR